MNESGHVVSQTKCWPRSWNPFGFGSTNAAKVSDVSAGNTQATTAGGENQPVVHEENVQKTDALLLAQVGVTQVTDQRPSDASTVSGSGVTGRPSNEDSGGSGEEEGSDQVGDLREKSNPVDKKAYKKTSTGKIPVLRTVRGIEREDKNYMQDFCEKGCLKAINTLKNEMGDDNFRSLIQLCVYDGKRTLLHVAAGGKHFEVCKLLIKFGADINRVSEWWGPGFGLRSVDPIIGAALVERGARFSPHAAAAIGQCPRSRLFAHAHYIEFLFAYR